MFEEVGEGRYVKSRSKREVSKEKGVGYGGEGRSVNRGSD